MPEDLEDDEDEGDDATFGVTSILNLTNDQVSKTDLLLLVFIKSFFVIIYCNYLDVTFPGMGHKILFFWAEYASQL